MQNKAYLGGYVTMENENNCVDLVIKYYNNEKKKLEEELNDLEHKLLANTELGVAANKYIEALAKSNLANKLFTIEELVPIGALTKEQNIKYESIGKQHKKKLEALQAHCAEVTSLLKAADTFEERVQLLSKYSILKGPNYEM